ncbi:uncharacterized protein LOC143291378 [Babylonia areolata]|uniref:uncharacterized protein LOC143291378 n=1 Tax=Babylonia areolata TaxID=304850 RepID=UPI003FD40386
MDEATSASDAVCCGSCGGDLEGAILMTCLHVLCRNCLPSPTSGSRSNQEVSYICPVCGPATSQSKTTSQNGVTPSVASHIASQPCTSIEEVKRRSENQSDAAAHIFDNDDDDEDEEEDENKEEEDDENEDPTNGAGRGEDVFTTTLTFPCPQHSHRDAQQFCLVCHKLACSKCLASFHRKCSQHLVTLAEAVTSRRPALNSLHTKLAQKVLASQESLHRQQKKLRSLEEQRTALIGQIQAQREALVRALEAKERQLIEQVTVTLDRDRARVEGRVERSQRSARAAEGQLCVLEAVMSVKGEPEILSLLPSLHSQLDAEAEDQHTADPDTSLHLAFHGNTQLTEVVHGSDLGHIGEASKAEQGKERQESDLRLTLMTSFHARSREDTCDPLLTDLLLLPTGDVILTDRDNKCVKKYNQTGHLLTRVPIPEVPSRLALVSHGKAAIAVMTRKVLLFLSLLGTVRILSSVRVKKHYCFLAAAGQGDGGQGQGPQGECRLLAATNMCDSIDLITEGGVLLRTLFTHRGERVNISRPLYLHAPNVQHAYHHARRRDSAPNPTTTTTTNNNNNNKNNNSSDTHPDPKEPEVAALVVDSARRVLFALDQDGQTAFTFRPKDENSLECPLGVATVPPSGAILLADRDRHRVLMLGRRGAFLREVLGEREGLHKPCALYCYHAGAGHGGAASGGGAGGGGQRRRRLGLTQVDGWVKVYKVE